MAAGGGAERRPARRRLGRSASARQVVARHRLVERDADARRRHAAQVEAARQRRRRSAPRRASPASMRDGVEEGLVPQREAGRAAPHRPAAAPAAFTRRAMRVSPSGPCQTAYMPAITASSTCAVQMLEVAFSRRICCSRVCSARRMAGLPAASTETPTSRPGISRLQRVLHRHVGRHAGRHSPSARRSAGCEPTTTSAPISPGGVSRQSDSGSAATMARPPAACTAAISGAQVAHLAGGAGILQQHARRASPRRPWPRSRPAARRRTAMPTGSARVAHHGAGSADAGRRRPRSVSDLRLVRGMRQRHRLGRRGRLVEQRGIGDRQAGQVGDHGLEVHQRLQPALRDLRLVGRVGGVPARVLQHVAQDHRRRVGAVVAQADQRLDVGAVRARPARAARRSPRPRSPAAAGPRGRLPRMAAGTVRAASSSRRRGADHAAAWRRSRPRAGRYGGGRTRRWSSSAVELASSSVASRVMRSPRRRRRRPRPSARRTRRRPSARCGRTSPRRSASLLTRAGFSARAALTSTTLPAIGA